MMSVQCKNCKRLEVANRDKNQYSCSVALTGRELVNITKQRECMYFIKKVRVGFRLFNANKRANEFLKEAEEKIEQNKAIKVEFKELNLNDGEIYIFKTLDELVDMLKNDGYDVRLKIKKKLFRTKEVKL